MLTSNVDPRAERIKTNYNGCCLRVENNISIKNNVSAATRRQLILFSTRRQQ